jgi:16S rRNA (cytidine1402-2'-O)-methyltransferase
MAGTLYIVATPIGNLRDMTERGVQILRSVDMVLAEDTRSAKKLLTHFDVKTSVKAYHQHSKESVRLEILNMLLQERDLALITDAGTPGISDPGNELIDFIYSNSAPLEFASARTYATPAGHASAALADKFTSQNAQIKIHSIPGVSAVSAVISVCGFNMQRYVFIGFMPKRKALKQLGDLRKLNYSFVYFDSPHRVVKNLEMVKEVFGEDVRVFIGRELTKIHETHYRGKVTGVIGQLSKQKVIKGEISVVVELKSSSVL